MDIQSSLKVKKYLNKYYLKIYNPINIEIIKILD